MTYVQSTSAWSLCSHAECKHKHEPPPTQAHQPMKPSQQTQREHRAADSIRERRRQRGMESGVNHKSPQPDDERHRKARVKEYRSSRPYGEHREKSGRSHRKHRHHSRSHPCTSGCMHRQHCFTPYPYKHKTNHCHGRHQCSGCGGHKSHKHHHRNHCSRYYKTKHHHHRSNRHKAHRSGEHKRETHKHETHKRGADKGGDHKHDARRSSHPNPKEKGPPLTARLLEMGKALIGMGDKEKEGRQRGSSGWQVLKTCWNSSSASKKSPAEKPASETGHAASSPSPSQGSPAGSRKNSVQRASVRRHSSLSPVVPKVPSRRTEGLLQFSEYGHYECGHE